MTVVWGFYWPVLLAALMVGILAGRSGFRQPKLPNDASAERLDEAGRSYRRKRNKALAIGVAAMLGILSLWHWPLGGASRFAAAVETEVASELERVGTPEFSGRLARVPLSRTLLVSGSANPFQQDGFVRLLREVPGVSRVRWSDQGRGVELPLFVEILLLCLVGFGAGVFFSAIVEIRRRVNAHWNW